MQLRGQEERCDEKAEVSNSDAKLDPKAKKKCDEARDVAHPIILALGKLRQEDYHEFKANLGFGVSSRVGCTIKRKKREEREKGGKE